jgi:hypothetical protein
MAPHGIATTIYLSQKPVARGGTLIFVNNPLANVAIR